MEWEDVKKFLDEHKDDEEFKTLISEIAPEKPITVDAVSEFLKTAEGQALVQPEYDRRVTAGIKTYRENAFEKEVKEQVAKEILRLNPQETPEQKQMRELRDDLEREKKAREKDNLKRQIVEEAAKRGLSTFWIDDFPGESLDEAKVFMGKIENSYKELETKTKNDLLANGSYKPGSGREREDKKSKIDLSKLDQKDLIALELEGKLDESLGS